MAKKSIFTTWAETPIKNVKTPIRRFDGESDEQEIIEYPVPEYEYEDCTNADVCLLLNHIKAMLFVLLVLKVSCLIFCSRK